MTDITRAVAIRRGLRNLDTTYITRAISGYMNARLADGTYVLKGTTAQRVRDLLSEDHATALELELGRAYDAGHIAGSGVRHQTDAEQHLAEVVRELTEYQTQTIGVHVSFELLDAIEKVRDPAAKNTLTPIPDGSFDVGVDL